MKPYSDNIGKATETNENFRKVVHTGQHQQLVLMSLLPGEEIGEEVHETTDQFFRFESGTGKVVIDGAEYPVGAEDAVVVPAGSQHNVINTSTGEKLKLYTVYSPPHHKDGTVHATKKDAENDQEDHL